MVGGLAIPSELLATNTSDAAPAVATLIISQEAELEGATEEFVGSNAGGTGNGDDDAVLTARHLAELFPGATEVRSVALSVAVPLFATGGGEGFENASFMQTLSVGDTASSGPVPPSVMQVACNAAALAALRAQLVARWGPGVALSCIPLVISDPPPPRRPPPPSSPAPAVISAEAPLYGGPSAGGNPSPSGCEGSCEGSRNESVSGSAVAPSPSGQNATHRRLTSGTGAQAQPLPHRRTLAASGSYAAGAAQAVATCSPFTAASADDGVALKVTIPTEAASSAASNGAANSRNDGASVSDMVYGDVLAWAALMQQSASMCAAPAEDVVVTSVVRATYSLGLSGAGAEAFTAACAGSPTGDSLLAGLSNRVDVSACQVHPVNQAGTGSTPSGGSSPGGSSPGGSSPGGGSPGGSTPGGTAPEGSSPGDGSTGAAPGGPQSAAQANEATGSATAVIAGAAVAAGVAALMAAVVAGVVVRRRRAQRRRRREMAVDAMGAMNNPSYIDLSQYAPNTRRSPPASQTARHHPSAQLGAARARSLARTLTLDRALQAPPHARTSDASTVNTNRTSGGGSSAATPGGAGGSITSPAAQLPTPVQQSYRATAMRRAETLQRIGSSTTARQVGISPSRGRALAFYNRVASTPRGGVNGAVAEAANGAHRTLGAAGGVLAATRELTRGPRRVLSGDGRRLAAGVRRQPPTGSDLSPTAAAGTELLDTASTWSRRMHSATAAAMPSTGPPRAKAVPTVAAEAGHRSSETNAESGASGASSYVSPFKSSAAVAAAMAAGFAGGSFSLGAGSIVGGPCSSVGSVGGAEDWSGQPLPQLPSPCVVQPQGLRASSTTVTGPGAAAMAGSRPPSSRISAGGGVVMVGLDHTRHSSSAVPPPSIPRRLPPVAFSGHPDAGSPVPGPGPDAHSQRQRSASGAPSPRHRASLLGSQGRIYPLPGPAATAQAPQQPSPRRQAVHPPPKLYAAALRGAAAAAMAAAAGRSSGLVPPEPALCHGSSYPEASPRPEQGPTPSDTVDTAETTPRVSEAGGEEQVIRRPAGLALSKSPSGRREGALAGDSEQE
ncbi:hypothetical protein HYH03_012103 [Edaphochlamys debaryana]|uniref:Uncharacterized protein n=1 Tax=Edaphochlamys debaryana TaxID=47281 RepID=A0A835XQW3_9CHLO|nr:hypothetical protein HYH03_012103 [Edaphochlamys debaryana]|eukprot:KAG2489467.1 hypothetical protein HYH03_012103 [Edaphochlamys debaryana]